MHDCGKITSPDYLIDKATKLETVHNRIHEIRTRFEVLWRDADIARIHAIGGQTWWRHFDDRLGLSGAEEAALAAVPPSALPARETLLADRPEHIGQLG